MDITLDGLIVYLQSIKEQITEGGKLNVSVGGRPVLDFEDSIKIDEENNSVDVQIICY